MQRRALELQTAAGEAPEAPDPLEAHPEVLDALPMPVLATAGDADMLDFKQGAAEIAARAPDGRVLIVERVGHLLPLEAPEEFRQLLLTFLKSSAL